MKYMNISNTTSNSKQFVLTLLVLLTLTISIVSGTANANTSEEITRHRLLLLKFKPSASSDTISQVEQIFYSLKNKVSGMDQVVWGKNLSAGDDIKFSHSVTLSFSSEQAIHDYELHPEHLALKEIAGPIIADFFQMNYHSE
jgi:hypothetical protein